MRRTFSNMFGVLALMLTAALTTSSRLVFAGDGVSLAITSSAWQDYNSNTLEYTEDGPSIAADGYLGTFYYDYAITGGTANFVIQWEVYSYDTTTEAWSLYQAAPLAQSASGDGTAYIDFYANPDSLPPGATYQMVAWVFSGSTSYLDTELSGGDPYLVSIGGTFPMPGAMDTSTPPGDDPPITHPELPPTGPVGPGTSS